jgi:GTPase SAR1 family protein
MIESQILFRIITLGDSGEGKTSIQERYTHGIFEDDFLSTVGI